MGLESPARIGQSTASSGEVFSDSLSKIAVIFTEGCIEGYYLRGSYRFGQPPKDLYIDPI